MPVRVGVSPAVQDLVPGQMWMGVLSAPTLLTAPIIVSLAIVGTLLVYTPGIYLGTVTSVQVQVNKNGVAIPGATNLLTYKPSAGDIGANITVTETAFNGASALISTSNSVLVSL